MSQKQEEGFMRRLTLILAGLFFVLASPVVAQNDKEKVTKDKVEKDKPDKDKLPAKLEEKPEPKYIPIAQLAGTLEQAGSESGMLKLRVPIRRIEANPQAQADLINKQPQWLRRQAEIMRNPNPYQRYQQMGQLVQEVQQAQRNLFVLKETHVDLELATAEELKVRHIVPNPGFDDMGNIRPLTKEVLKELKGKDNLPGFQAERTDLKNGQTVLLLAARERANKDPNAKPIATIIVILAEPKP
jgi:hypothetical protein